MSMLLAGVLSVPVIQLTPPIVAALAFAVFTVTALVAVTIAPDLIALQRRHYWRWWWRTSDGDCPFWPGTRIPRGPRRPT